MTRSVMRLCGPARLPPEPQRLLDEVARLGGLAFFAHPVDPAAPKFRQEDLSWVDWGLRGYTGIEVWDFMSDFKARLPSIPAGLFYSYNPPRIARGPFPEAIRQWDRLLAQGRRVVAIGGGGEQPPHQPARPPPPPPLPRQPSSGALFRRL